MVNHYLIVETTVNNSVFCYKGQLLDINQDTFDMETYGDDGEPEGRYIGLTPTITSVQIDSRELRELSLRVKFHRTEIDVSDAELDKASGSVSS